MICFTRLYSVLNIKRISSIFVWSILFNKMVLSGINSTFAKSRNIKVDLMKIIFTIILAVIVMISIKWVGLMIINSLLILPA